VLWDAEIGARIIEDDTWSRVGRGADLLAETDEDDHTYQGRLFWPSDFREEALARLLALNAERNADEARRGIAHAQKVKNGTNMDGDDDLDIRPACLDEWMKAPAGCT
jgi:hypothetical protein